MTRLLLLVALVSGCTPAEDQITHCHKHGYVAKGDNWRIDCCSVLNGDDVCIRASSVTRHRRETGQ